ncbi:hypothetical protein RRG08_056591 [Elysia crispata]|uniref:Uncharacterized protein n=1 Tax=Elysia crispata TaxID=231223 RepID=A0AAE1DAK9_9GAST|nr:hypothetical protein RRG08_056591 [Elysia crispata]
MGRAWADRRSIKKIPTGARSLAADVGYDIVSWGPSDNWADVKMDFVLFPLLSILNTSRLKYIIELYASIRDTDCGSLSSVSPCLINRKFFCGAVPFFFLSIYEKSPVNI